MAILLKPLRSGDMASLGGGPRCLAHPKGQGLVRNELEPGNEASALRLDVCNVYDRTRAHACAYTRSLYIGYLEQHCCLSRGPIFSAS